MRRKDLYTLSLYVAAGFLVAASLTYYLLGDWVAFACADTVSPLECLSRLGCTIAEDAF